jgi:hypothetical protein
MKKYPKKRLLAMKIALLNEFRRLKLGYRGEHSLDGMGDG